MGELYRYHPMEDRRIRVRQWLSRAQAIEVIRGSYDPSRPATRVNAIRDKAIPIPYDPPVGYPTKPTLGTVNRAGVPIGTVLTTMTPGEVNALAAGVEVVDKHIVGQIDVKGTVPRVFRNCLIEGTDTEGTIEQVEGEYQLTEVTAPHYAINNSESSAPVELYNCEVSNAKKLLLVPGGAILDHCWLHDAGEDGIYASIQQNNIAVTDSIISRCGNLRFHARLGFSTSLMHADLAQIRGQSDSLSAIFTRVVFDGQSVNTTGGPTGDGWGTVTAAVLAQTADGPINDVQLIDCWAATGGNWTFYMEDKNFGKIQNFTITGTEISRSSTSGPLVNHGASDTATISGNIDLENQESIDATMIAGVGW